MNRLHMLLKQWNYHKQQEEQEMRSEYAEAAFRHSEELERLSMKWDKRSVHDVVLQELMKSPLNPVVSSEKPTFNDLNCGRESLLTGIRTGRKNNL